MRTIGEEDIKVYRNEVKRTWVYYFHDPYGGLISYGNFRTQWGARHAAERERRDVARKLGNECGL